VGKNGLACFYRRERPLPQNDLWRARLPPSREEEFGPQMNTGFLQRIYRKQRFFLLEMDGRRYGSDGVFCNEFIGSNGFFFLDMDGSRYGSDGASPSRERNNAIRDTEDEP